MVYRLTFIGLIIIGAAGVAVNVLHRNGLPRKRWVGYSRQSSSPSLALYSTAAYVQLPFDFAIEGVRIIAALLGALIIAVFLVLLRGVSRRR